eukprot:COSAG03_NODE_5393_length_1259_cov_103.272414_1_plen_89_part_00
MERSEEGVGRRGAVEERGGSEEGARRQGKGGEQGGVAFYGKRGCIEQEDSLSLKEESHWPPRDSVLKRSPVAIMLASGGRPKSQTRGG